MSERPLRILHVSTRLIIGGSQENTILSCERQMADGHEVHLAYGPIYGPEGSMLARVRGFATGDGRAIATHEVPDLIRAIHPLRDARCLGQLRRLVRDVDPDVVHTHSSKAGILGRAAGWREGGRAGRRAIVHTIHGSPFHPYERAWKNRIYIESERWAASRCHAIVSVADAMTTLFRARGIGRPDMFTTVRSGMEVDRFLAAPADAAALRAELGIDPEALVVGTVARLAEHKGHDDLVDALAPLLRARPELHLLWVGDGWWRERLEGRLRDAGLASRVTITGMVPPERVPDLLHAMDLLVHPSYREGLPRTVVQALLAGVPVVATDVDGTREVCLDRVTGRLVPPGDPEALRGAVEWMLEDADRRAKTAEAGRASCRTAFSVRAMVDGLDRVYRDVLERLPGRPGAAA